MAMATASRGLFCLLRSVAGDRGDYIRDCVELLPDVGYSNIFCGRCMSFLSSCRSGRRWWTSFPAVRAPLLQPGMVAVLVLFCRGTLEGLEEVWWMVWRLFFAARWRWVLIHGRRSLGCVPGRGASTEFFFCGSMQSLRAMGLLPIWEMLSVFFNSGRGGGRQRRRRRSSGCAKVPLDFVVISVFYRGLCAIWLGQLSPVSF